MIKLGRPSKATAKAITDPPPAAKAAVAKHDAKACTKVFWGATDAKFATLKAAVLGLSSDITIPPTTLTRSKERFQEAAEEHKVPVHMLTRLKVFPEKSTALLKEHEVEMLQAAIVHRDASNKGMKRKEVISLIMEMVQTSNRKKCELHYEYLVRAGRLTQLKRGGKVSTAQGTTTNRSQVLREQQLRWHCTVDQALHEQRRLNQPADEFAKVADHFVGNLDETCYMGSHNGPIKVIASLARKKTEKITEDDRESITSVRMGTAAGASGPFIFLAKGKSDDNIPKSLRGDLSKNRKGVPLHSRVIMTPNAYMTDEAWINLVEDFCKGVRSMPVVRDHPEWWFVLTLDGYGSHINNHEASKMFANYNVMVVKEEADTSQVNQAYDQLVAKYDKRNLTDIIEVVRNQLNGKMDQWHLITLAIVAQARVPAKSWIDSHTRVNTNPKTRVDFDAWIERLESKSILMSDELFYADGRTLYDAMPAVWKNLPVEDRHAILGIIDKAHSTGTKVWTKEIIVKLAKYVKLEDVVKLRACHMASKQDPGVIVRIESNVSENQPTVNASTESVDDYFSWKPKKLMDKYKADKKDHDNQMKLWLHMTNNVAQTFWDREKPVLPSDYLDVHVTTSQSKFLNPTAKNVLLGYITHDVKGKGAMQKLAKRRLDMIEGNVASYSRMLNDPKRLKMIQDYNELVSEVAKVSADKETEKERNKEEKAAVSTTENQFLDYQLRRVIVPDP